MTAMTIPFRKLKAQWMKNPAFRAEYKALLDELPKKKVVGQNPTKKTSLNAR